MTSIIDFWYPEGDKFQKWWFEGKSSSEDTNIKQKQIRDLIAYNRLSGKTFWKCEHKCLEGILYYDQFFRHIQENTEDHESIAVELCLHAIQHDWLPNEPHLLVFCLLPLRHTRNIHFVNYCIRLIEKKNMESHSVYYDKFLRASMKTELKCDLFKDDISWLSWIDKYRDILCDEVNYIYEQNNDFFKSTDIWKCFINFINKRFLNIGEKALIVSLSGGVDSMVFLYLCQLYKFINAKFRFGAVHINWNQRDESTREADFLEEYLIKSNIPYIYKNITHLSRKEDRLLFESKGREIRFELYRQAMLEWNGDCVFLGHHHGDIVENVFLNIINSNHFFNLEKMTEETLIDSVLIVRPFLIVDKSDIYEIAIKKLIPFFKNTTPIWSNRGELRNTIFPSIEKQFGKGFEKGLISTAKKCKEMGQILDCLLIPYMGKIEQMNENEFRFPFEIDYPFVFYESMFEKFMYSHRKPKIRNKSLEAWYHHAFNSNGKIWKSITLSKICQIILEDNKQTMKIKFTS